MYISSFSQNETNIPHATKKKHNFLSSVALCNLIAWIQLHSFIIGAAINVWCIMVILLQPAFWVCYYFHSFHFPGSSAWPLRDHLIYLSLVDDDDDDDVVVVIVYFICVAGSVLSFWLNQACSALYPILKSIYYVNVHFAKCSIFLFIGWCEWLCVYF